MFANKTGTLATLRKTPREPKVVCARGTGRREPDVVRTANVNLLESPPVTSA